MPTSRCATHDAVEREGCWMSPMHAKKHPVSGKVQWLSESPRQVLALAINIGTAHCRPYRLNRMTCALRARAREEQARLAKITQSRSGQADILTTLKPSTASFRLRLAWSFRSLLGLLLRPAPHAHLRSPPASLSRPSGGATLGQRKRRGPRLSRVKARARQVAHLPENCFVVPANLWRAMLRQGGRAGES